MDVAACDEIEALAVAYVAERRVESGRCGATLDAYSQPVSCQREAGHAGNRHEAPGITWVAA